MSLERVPLRWFFIVSLFLLFVDQAVKAWFASTERIIDAGFVNFRLAWNTGASFSLLEDNNALFIWVALIVLGVIVWQYDYLSPLALRAIVIVSGGIFSNLLDRVFRGAVVDYIDLGWFPVFNIADAMIVCSGLWLAWIWWREEERKKGEKRSRSSS